MYIFDKNEGKAKLWYTSANFQVFMLWEIWKKIDFIIIGKYTFQYEDAKKFSQQKCRFIFLILLDVFARFIYFKKLR